MATRAGRQGVPFPGNAWATPWLPLVAILALVASPADAQSPAGPPAPPSRAEVLERSFPGFTPEDAIEGRMRVSKRVAWSLVACDVVSTFTAKRSESNPLAFGSKPLAVALSGLGTYGSLRAEEYLLRRRSRGWADVARYGRWAWSVFACGWNLSVTF